MHLCLSMLYEQKQYKDIQPCWAYKDDYYNVHPKKHHIIKSV